MGLDWGMIGCRNTLEKLGNIVRNLPHGKRDGIEVDLREFTTKMEEKYGKSK